MALLPAIAVLDIGKSNLKLEVFNQSRESLSQHSVPNSIRPGPPYAHADLERIWDFTVSALTEAARNFVLSDIVVTTHGATAAVLDGEGLALPVLDYEATDPEEYSAEYDLLARDFSNTQSPNLPAGLNLARQLFWLSRRFPEHFARATSILTYPQYWAWRLSGIAASEVTSLGCHSDLWEPARGDHSCFIRHMGWKRLFPPMRAAWDLLGTLLPDLAQTTGIPASCRIRCGAEYAAAGRAQSRRNHPQVRREGGGVPHGARELHLPAGGQDGRGRPTRGKLGNHLRHHLWTQ